MALADNRDFSEDIFADTRMSFGEHLEDLRVHLLRALYGFLVAFALSFFIAKPVLIFIARPVEIKLGEFYQDRVSRVAADLRENDPHLAGMNQPREVTLAFPRQELTRALGLPQETAQGDEWVSVPVRVQPLTLAIALNEAERHIGRRPHLSTLSVQEAFMAYFKVAIVCGFVIGSPWIFLQMWLFVAAGLYPHEKRYVHVYLPFSLALFIGGVLLCEFIVLPKAIEALLWFNQWIDLEPDIRFNEWLGFAILMPLVFGVSFQLPLVMMFLERIGIFEVEDYAAKWRIAFFVIQVFAAVLTPSVDLISMELLALPMFGLYGLGILLCRLNPRRRELGLDVPDAEEMVEV